MEHVQHMERCLNDLLKMWKERLERYENNPDIAKGMESQVAMGCQQGRVISLKMCILELELLMICLGKTIE